MVNLSSLLSSRRHSLSHPPTESGTYDRAPRLSDYLAAGLAQPPHLSELPYSPAYVQPLDIAIPAPPADAPPKTTSRQVTVPAFLHLPSSASLVATPSIVDEERGGDGLRVSGIGRTAAILLSGAGGGVTGPSALYLSLASKLSSLPQHTIPTLRLDYRHPARTLFCVQDLQAAMDFLEAQLGIRQFVLVGWSFGGAPVLSVAGRDERVIAVAAIASQTAETDGVRQLAPRPLLLLHGTADRVLSPSCSKKLYAAYGEDEGGHRELKLFEGDDHALTHNIHEAEEIIGGFVVRCARRAEDGAKEGGGAGGAEDLGAQGQLDSEIRDVFRKELVRDAERVGLMEKGGDLRGREKID